MMQVFCGYDHRQPIAFTVLSNSILRRASKPIALRQLRLSQLPMTRRGLTEFTYSRFLVPYLSGYSGTSIFCDSDMLCLDDIYKIVRHVDNSDAVSVVKNKMQFEWASMIVFNNAKCKILTPEFVENESNTLYDFSWASSVGELPSEWNHIVGYDAPNPNAKLIHYTQGIPCFPETRGCEFSEEWIEEYRNSISTVPWVALMGNSVHMKPVLSKLNKRLNPVVLK